MIERASDRWVSIALSVLFHGMLVAAVVYGFWVYRQSRPPIPTPTLAIQATVVDSRSLSGAAKTPPAPQPPPPPPPAEPPPPEPVEPTGPPQPTPEELAQREQAQKDQEQKERVQREQAEKDEAEKEQAQREQADREAAEQQRQAQEKRQREAHEKAEAERKAQEAKKKAEEQRLAEEKAQRAAEDKERADSEAELRNSLAAEERANQLRNNGALVSWVSQITARIQRAWLRPPSARQGIQCVLHITQAPGGQVLSAKIESCNGDQAVRESIEAAAYRASPLPPPPDPSLFERDLEVTFRPD
jgi:colicin import membrane protein